MPSVSIIIATSSRPAPLAETLRSLAATEVPAGWEVELLLLENVARNGAEDLLRAVPAGRFSAVRYFFEPVRGKARALNLALGQATGDILLFTDDDVRFPADWIGRLCAPIVAGHAEAVAGGVRLAPHLLRPWMNHTHRAWLASTADYLAPENPSEMCGANMAVSRRVFERIGGFDPELGPGITGGGEESLLSWQIKQAGFRLVGAADVQIEHHLNPDRLCYKNWTKAADLKGQTRAYLRHHWEHAPLHFARLAHWFYSAKLAFRRRLAPAKAPDAEGIEPWELSYIESAAMCARFLQESRRPRNYEYHGLKKLTAEVGDGRSETGD